MNTYATAPFFIGTFCFNPGTTGDPLNKKNTTGFRPISGSTDPLAGPFQVQERQVAVWLEAR